MPHKISRMEGEIFKNLNRIVKLLSDQLAFALDISTSYALLRLPFSHNNAPFHDSRNATFWMALLHLL